MHNNLGAERNGATAAKQAAKSTRLLLVAEDSAELAVLSLALESERIQVQAIAVEKLEGVL